MRFNFAFVNFLVLILFCFSFVRKESFLESGTASYYANRFHGRTTSSGEVFNQNYLTAAHKTLPFGTILKVLNTRNDSIVYVKVNDRLPMRSRKVIDLSLKAAQKLNFVNNGMTQVNINKIH